MGRRKQTAHKKYPEKTTLTGNTSAQWARL